MPLVPLFHAAGLYMTIISSLYWDRPVYFSSPGKPLTSDTLLANLEYCEADAVLLPPIILDEISQSDDGIKALAKLNAVTSVGGKIVV